jgi:hypothetical protein
VDPGSSDAGHLYQWRPGSRGDRPLWRRLGNALEYERDLPGQIHLLARATLEADGVRFHYEFRNESAEVSGTSCKLKLPANGTEIERPNTLPGKTRKEPAPTLNLPSLHKLDWAGQL